MIVQLDTNQFTGHGGSTALNAPQVPLKLSAVGGLPSHFYSIASYSVIGASSKMRSGVRTAILLILNSELLYAVPVPIGMKRSVLYASFCSWRRLYAVYPQSCRGEWRVPSQAIRVYLDRVLRFE